MCVCVCGCLGECETGERVQGRCRKNLESVCVERGRVSEVGGLIFLRESFADYAGYLGGPFHPLKVSVQDSDGGGTQG